jgi:hypothetical protein
MQINKGKRDKSQLEGSPLEDMYDNSETVPAGNSFLAPVADLLNFGPPCTRGMYNHTTDSFEIIATCPFHQGQEITFFYADACEDVFMANYGFTMPMLVPKCWNPQDEATAKIRHLSRDLSFAYQQLDIIDQQMDELLTVLHECHCENQTDYLKIHQMGNNNNNNNNNNNRDGRQGGGGGRPPKVPSPTPKDIVVDDHNNFIGIQQPSNRNSEYPSYNMKPRSNNSNNNNNNNNNNDARHAIRGQGRRSSSKERRDTFTFSSPSLSSSSSSPKGRRRPHRGGASRKSEF